MRYFVSHEGDNLSDHSLLTIQIDFNVSYTKYEDNCSIRKPIWTKASPEDIELYKLALDNYLNDINVPSSALHCSNMSCDHDVHLKMVDKFHNDIIHACIAASDKYISHNKTCKGTKPGWQDEVEPYRQTAIFWHHSGPLMFMSVLCRLLLAKFGMKDLLNM